MEEKKLVRSVVEKIRCVMVYGMKEDKVPSWAERDNKERGRIREVLSVVTDDPEHANEGVEEYFRIGKFEEGKMRPTKIKFASQVQAEEVLSGSWKMSEKEDMKGVWINKDLDKDERKQLNELVSQAKDLNGKRTEEEKKQFFWRVRDLRLWKKYYMGN